MCIDIVEIWFGIAIEYSSSILDIAISPWHDKGGVLSFHVFIFKMLLVCPEMSVEDLIRNEPWNLRSDWHNSLNLSIPCGWEDSC